MLYAEITALSDKDGYCRASNKYFAELYGVSKTTISTAISELVECGYIYSLNDYNNRQIMVLQLSNNFNTTPPKNTNDNNIDTANADEFKKEISDVERWTEDVKTNNDHIFTMMLANEILYLDPSTEKKLPEIYTAHEAKCIRENYEFKSQQHFRKSLIQYIKSYLNNDRTKTNSGASKGTKPNSSAIIEHRTDF
jgi:hypothetical protein